MPDDEIVIPIKFDTSTAKKQVEGLKKTTMQMFQDIPGVHRLVTTRTPAIPKIPTPPVSPFAAYGRGRMRGMDIEKLTRGPPPLKVAYPPYREPGVSPKGRVGIERPGEGAIPPTRGEKEIAKKTDGVSSGLGSVVKFTLRSLKYMAIMSVGMLNLVKFAKFSFRSTIGQSNYLRAVMRILSVAFALFFKPFGDFLGALLMPMAKMMIQMAKDFTKKLMPYLKALISGDMAPGDFIVKAIELMIPYLVEGTKKFVDYLVKIVPSLIEAFTKIIPLIADGISQIIPIIVNAFVQLAPVILDGVIKILDALIAGWDKISPVLDEAFNKLGPYFDKAWELISPYVDKAFNKLGILLDKVWNDFVVPLLQKAWKVLEPLIITFLTNLLMSLPGIVINLIKGAIKIFGDNLLGMVLGVIIGVLIAAATAATGGLALVIIAVFASVGAVIFPKIVSALESGFNVLKGLGSWIWNKITSLVGFGSPEGRAIGGTVSAGSAYMVGERGPELFVPATGGKIVPNGEIGRGTTIGNITVNIQTQKIDSTNLDWIAKQVSDRIYTDVRRRVTF